MLDVAMSDVTQILQQIEDGDPSAAEQLLPLVYDELRKLAAARMAAEPSDHTLQATALVHEAYVRLVDGQRPQHWNGRGHFFGAAAEAMRRILVESARSKRRQKRHPGGTQVELDSACAISEAPQFDLLAVDDALTKLSRVDSTKAELVKLRYFAGLTMPQAAAAMGLSLATAERHWTFARTWLYAEMADDHRIPL
jgi:RNA polymerase sigma factor (TIGR02999 family)